MCQKYRNGIFAQHQSFATFLRLDFLREAEQRNQYEADYRLTKLHSCLRFGDISLSDDDDTLRNYCDNLAHRCRLARASMSEHACWNFCQRLLSRHRIEEPNSESAESDLARVLDPQWWTRRARMLRNRSLEAIRRDIGLVQHRCSPYSSLHSVNRRHFQKEAHKRYLESKIAINEIGQEFSLQEIADKNVSNPKVRRAELMVRIRGFEEVATLLGHAAEFYTVSAPGYMHATRKSGIRNPNFDGSTTQDVHAYLNNVWRLTRAKLHRLGISPYGFRVVEPHHDGTPHWHLLLFMPKDQQAIVRSVLQEYALKTAPDEKGAQEYRFKAISIESEKGTAAGYIAKYISKNIDGAHLEYDLDGNPADKTAAHIDAWASDWGIRQFQQIGGPSVTVWRELRRLNSEEGLPTSSGEETRRCADKSDWAAFCLAMGGKSFDYSSASIKPLYEPPLITDTTTGEVTHCSVTQYGDLAPPRLIGLVVDGVEIRTRVHDWHISTAHPPPKRE